MVEFLVNHLKNKILRYYIMKWSTSLGKYAIDRLIPAPAPEDSKFDGIYTYTSEDFKGQNYVITIDIITGEFAVPHRDANNQPAGLMTWQSVAAVTDSEVLEVHESLTATIKGETFTGTALSVANGGFYEEGKPYKFCLTGCGGKELDVVITNVGNGKREAVVKSVTC